jgi:hypothetical protein
VRAQESWEVVLLRSGGNVDEIITVTESGIQTRIALPDTLQIDSSLVALSPDRQRLATITGNDVVQIANLADGTCCAEFAFTSALSDTVSLGGFSPDSTKLAIAYMVQEPFETAILALDVTTGEIAAFTDMAAGQAGRLQTYPELDSWREDGVYFVPQCIQCVEGAAGTAKGLWNPATGAVTSTGEGIDPRGDLLPLANAEIFPTYALDYPAQPVADMVAVGGERYGLRNTVTMSGARAENGRAIVYFDANNAAIDRVRWVADGSAFIVFAVDREGANVLVTPEGEPQPIEFSAANFLVGTPDGWLTLEDSTLVHYALGDGVVTRQPFDSVAGSVTVLFATPLGSAGGASFPTVPPPARVTCEGSVESRLVAGHRGQVVPGPANNVRDTPSTGGEIVAKIAGGAQFVVLEGPVCAEGLAWWRIAYLDWEGWTAEGSGQHYWLAPVD